jgi:hypothetical protein
LPASSRVAAVDQEKILRAVCIRIAICAGAFIGATCALAHGGVLLYQHSNIFRDARNIEAPASPTANEVIPDNAQHAVHGD